VATISHFFTFLIHSKLCSRRPALSFYLRLRHLEQVIFLDHKIVHFKIPANDAEKMKKFYDNIFGLLEYMKKS